MADDIAKSNFNDILSNLKRKFQIIDSKWTDNRLYEVKFRTQIAVQHEDYNKYCDHWVDEFSYVTNTVWVNKISNTGPKVKFRKQYQCWTYESKEVNKALLFDAKKCRATLDIKVLGDTSRTKRSNRFLRLGLNVLVKINFHHLHPVNTTNNYSFFVHYCKPLQEAPRPPALSNEKVSQLVAKVVETAPITSQKAAERAQETLKKQCVVPTHFIPNVSQPVAASPQTPSDNSNFGHISVGGNQPPLTQVIVNASDVQTNENVYYVHQVVFDSATQTLREVVSAPNNTLHDVSHNQILQVQIPAETAHIPPIVSNLQTDGSHIIQHF